MIDRLLESAQRYRRISEQLEDPAVHAQPGRLAALMRELGRLRPRAELHARWEALAAQRSAATTALAERDPELAALARQELRELDLREEELHAELRRQVAEEDPDRGRNVLLELRAGTGGDEAGLFVGDLLRLYTRFAEQEGLAVELLTCHPGEAGGYREAVLCISGERAWDLFRFEGGGHRVQRVPETEAQGRIHTSAATVAVLPEAEESEIEIRDGDLRIDTFRSSGPGGQSVNKTSSAIRITHLPSGTVVQCQDESSQHKNKARALRLLRSRLREAAESARKAGEDSARRTQIGSGDRSERIRTYNWPQNRVTDHRTKTSYSLESVVLGRLGEIVEDLRRRDLDQKLAALGEGAS